MLVPVSFTRTFASAIAISAGNGQSATVSTNVATAPAVLVTDGRGNAVSGVSVTFSVTAGGGSATGTSTTTNASGIATVGSWTLGASPGSNTLHAVISGMQSSPSVDFTATGTAIPVALTYRSSSQESSGGSVITYSAVGIGAASSDRRVHVVAHGLDNSVGVSLSSATIGGVAATITVQANGANFNTTAILIANVTSGTTADIVLTFSGAVSQTGIDVWTSTGLSSNTATASDVSYADPATATLATTNGGFLIAGATRFGATAYTWTNATERSDVATGFGAYTGADASTSGANISPSADPDGTSIFQSGAFATW